MPRARVISAVYVLEHTSGAFYIGATADLARRWSSHKSNLRDGCCNNPGLKELAAQHGLSGFSIRVLAEIERPLLEYYETRALDAYLANPQCLNVSPRGYVPSEEHRRKIARAMTGKQASAETRHRRSVALRGVPKSEEARRNMSLAGKPNHRRGYTLSAEARANISSTRRARLASGEIKVKGYRLSEEHRRKLSESRKAGIASGRIVVGNHMLGRKASEETRAKLRAAHARRLATRSQALGSPH